MEWRQESSEYEAEYGYVREGMVGIGIMWVLGHCMRKLHIKL